MRRDTSPRAQGAYRSQRTAAGMPPPPRPRETIRERHVADPGRVPPDHARGGGGLTLPRFAAFGVRCGVHVVDGHAPIPPRGRRPMRPVTMGGHSEGVHHGRVAHAACPPLPRAGVLGLRGDARAGAPVGEVPQRDVAVEATGEDLPWPPRPECHARAYVRVRLRDVAYAAAFARIEDGDGSRVVRRGHVLAARAHRNLVDVVVARAEPPWRSVGGPATEATHVRNDHSRVERNEERVRILGMLLDVASSSEEEGNETSGASGWGG